MTLPQIPIPSDADPAIQTLMRLFRRTHERFWAAMTPLTAEQMDWRPWPQADSIAAITEHVIAAERGLISLVSGQWSADVSSNGVPHRVGRSGAGRSGLPAGAYLADLAVQYERGMACLASLKDARLQEPLLRPWDGRESTIEREVDHMLDHLAYHRGQIAYLTLMDGFPPD